MSDRSGTRGDMTEAGKCVAVAGNAELTLEGSPAARRRWSATS
jgi:hypothetical protein